MSDTYKIVRMWNPFKYPNKRNRTIERGLTLEEAQEHCRDPKTRQEGAWFDGYSKE